MDTPKGIQRVAQGTVRPRRRGGRPRRARWLSETAQLPLETKALNRAVANGHHDVVEWLHRVAKPPGAELCPLFKPSTSYGAAFHGRLATLQWMAREGYSWDRLSCLEAASVEGWYAIVEWIYGQIDSVLIPHQKMIDIVNEAKRGRRRRKRGRDLERDHDRVVDMLRRGMILSQSINAYPSL